MRPFSVLNKSRCLNITKRNQDKETLENMALLWSIENHQGFGLPDPGPVTWQAALFRLVQGHLQDIFIRHQKPGIWCLTSATEQSVSDGFI